MSRPDADLSLRIAELTATRAAALDAHATELRRIERSLHDGTQNRLVTVTVLLGAARRMVARDPAGAEELLERAHSSAEQALAELRTVARGILPPVLTDRGLEGALTGLAASCPVPCRIDVDAPARRAASVEATAYSVVAETSRRWRVPRPTRPAGTVQSERGGRRRGVISNTGDMTWFYRALLGGQLLKPAQLAQMRTTVRATEPDPVWPGARYGLGLMESPLTCGGTYYGHAGDLPGYSTRDGVSADGRDVVVLEATGDGSTGDPSTEEANNALIDQQLCAAEAE